MSAKHQRSFKALVEMGFDRECAMRALCANNGDMMEAIDMLSTMSAASMLEAPRKPAMEGSAGASPEHRSDSNAGEKKHPWSAKQALEDSKRSKRRMREKMKREIKKTIKEEEKQQRLEARMSEA